MINNATGLPFTKEELDAVEFPIISIPTVGGAQFIIKTIDEMAGVIRYKIPNPAPFLGDVVIVDKHTGEKYRNDPHFINDIDIGRRMNFTAGFVLSLIS